MAELLLGPVLRHVGTEDATIWVETDSPSEVEIRGRKARTFAVEGHHFAILPIEGLEPGTTTPYTVALDGQVRWPEADSSLPQSAIRTLEPGAPIRICFGSCRVALPHEPPYSLPKDEHEQGLEQDALYAIALRMLSRPVEEWPHLLLMVGDQVYVDEGSPSVREWIRSRRDVSKPPGEEVADFDEYAALYHESWGDPVIRWLFSTVSTAMVIDDHDMHDDWNISRAWTEEMRQHEWWQERVESGLMSYWIYQHIGNLSPEHLEQNPQYVEARSGADAGPMLRDFARAVGEEHQGTRWSFVRELDGARLIVLDDRTGRVLDHGRRSILDDEEWAWLLEQAQGDRDHLLIATSDPYLLAPGLHYLESWSEAVCDGAWGERASGAGERMRRALDLDHWAAFQRSFRGLAELMREIGSGKRGRAPASIGVLSGDVHHAYLAEAAFRRDAGVRSAVYQAVCSPFRNALDSREQRVVKAGMSRPFELATRSLARAIGVRDPEIRWRFTEGPFFDNQVATLELDGPASTMRLERTVRDPEGRDPRLELSFERSLSPRSAASSGGPPVSTPPAGVGVGGNQRGEEQG
jgi:PhoD-like phosphatase